MSRNGDINNGEIKWFDCKPGVILHTVNAFETENGQVVLHALQSEPRGEKSYLTNCTTMFLYEWVLNIKTGIVVSENCLNSEELVEFPIIDERYTSVEVDACYALGVYSIGGPVTTYNNPKEAVLVDRVVKFALTDDNTAVREKGDVIDRFMFPDGWFGVTEPTIVPKEGDVSGSVYLMVIGTVLG